MRLLHNDQQHSRRGTDGFLKQNVFSDGQKEEGKKDFCERERRAERGNERKLNQTDIWGWIDCKRKTPNKKENHEHAPMYQTMNEQDTS